MSVEVADGDIWPLLLCTIRYAMGRSSYIVGDACDYYRRYRARLTAYQRKQIGREIAEAIALEERLGRVLGHDMDHREWKRLADEIAAQEGTL